MLEDFPESREPSILEGSRVSMVYGAGTLSRLGEYVRMEGGRRVLVVTDTGIQKSGHVDRAVASLKAAGLSVAVFDGTEENPTTLHVDAGVEVGREARSDFIVGLGGGSSLDCAKGVNFILTNGGEMSDYWGTDLARKPMLPMIGVPTTAGTGSEAQSYALISDPVTHQKMACGDKKAACRLAVLDPELTRTQPRAVAALTGLDAVTHAVETSATRTRTDCSRHYSRLAWDHLESFYERAVADRQDEEARSAMLLGAHYSGIAIENSMLGAAHACANPLTAMIGLVHGKAVGVMLPHVIRFNCATGSNPYSDLDEDPKALIARIERLLRIAGIPENLASVGVDEAMVPELSRMAATQWTGKHNPRPVKKADFERLYAAAL